MLNQETINTFIDDIWSYLPEGIEQLPNEAHALLREAIQGALIKMDLVTREEFDVQTKVLARTRQQLKVLEQQLQQLESGHTEN